MSLPADAPGESSARVANDQFRISGFEHPFALLSGAGCRQVIAHHANPARPEPLDWWKGGAATDPFYFVLARNERLLSRLRPILGDDIILWGVDFLRRKPQQIHPWHCDIESSAPDGRFASVWIGLENVSRESSLTVISRSHLFGRTIQEEAANRGLKRGEATSQTILAWARARDPEAKLVNLEMRDGDAVIFDGRLWHGTHNVREEGTRAALLLQYAAADCQVRMITPDHLEWPFRFRDDTCPPVVVVSGRASSAVNRVVPAPQPASRASLLGAIAKPLALPLPRDAAKPWTAFPQFSGATRMLPQMGCHVSVLAPGYSPHPPHAHAEEEILVVLEGEPDIAIASREDDPQPRWKRISPGHFSFYPAFQHHTIRNTSAQPATYLMLKWLGANRQSADMQPVLANFRSLMHESDSRDFAPRLIFEKPTRYLKKLHCHLTRLKPGAGYAPHKDPYDVAIILLDGKIETIGSTLENNGVVYYSAGEPHGIRNVGAKDAIYLVFEFHAV
jgi:mannose-6-phosphate isomerase-like protein (cupin superfamily)